MRRLATRFAAGTLALLILPGCGGSRDRAGGGTTAADGAAAGPSATGAAPQEERPMSATAPGEVRYVAEDQPAIVLRVRGSADGAVTGTLSDGSETLPLAARRAGRGFAGTIGPADGAMRVVATGDGDRLVLELSGPDGSQRLAFRRAAGDATAPGAAGGESVRNVVINGHRLSEAELARTEQSYRIRIPDADYWYDPVLGAWGAKGHPTSGFIAPGLELGGTLRADASAGNTGVFVNGRDLPPADLIALQGITGPVAPGRYFITARGLAGYEGGPPLWDLSALAARSGGGGSNTWQSRITGASGFSDGHTGAVFLPNGGIVSTGD